MGMRYRGHATRASEYYRTGCKKLKLNVERLAQLHSCDSSVTIVTWPIAYQLRFAIDLAHFE